MALGRIFHLSVAIKGGRAMLKIFKPSYMIMIAGLMCLVFLSAQALAPVRKEIVIKVQANIIALPEGEAAKIPVSAARVRSTELRQLNEKYNAVYIEKLFEVKKQGTPESGSGIKGLKSLEKEQTKETVDLTTLFTQEIKKELKAQGKEVNELKDTYLIGFEFESEKKANLQELLGAYRALKVVSFVQDIVRTK